MLPDTLIYITFVRLGLLTSLLVSRVEVSLTTTVLQPTIKTQMSNQYLCNIRHQSGEMQNAILFVEPL